MSTFRLIMFAILALPVAEVVIFLAAANSFGAFKTFFALVAGSLLGVAILANSGRGLLGPLRRAASEGRVAAKPSARLATAAAGLLLAIPGFLTDIAGLLLLIPFVRRWIFNAIPRGRSPDGVIDLNPAEWRRIPEPRNRRTPKSPGSQRRP